MTKAYEVVPVRFVRPDEVDMDGYAWEYYFDPPISDEVFASRSEAEAEARQSYLGPDADGVGLEWAIREVPE